MAMSLFMTLGASACSAQENAIIPEIAYPDSYEETKLISQKERDEDLRPAIKNQLANLDKYSVVFIGAPIWYGGPPKIVETFYEAYPELAGKTIIPFGTHEGSGTASLAPVLKQYFPNAVIKQTLGLTGREVKNSPTESRKAVKNWINRIGITQ